MFSQFLCNFVVETLAELVSECSAVTLFCSCLTPKIKWCILNRSIASWSTLCMSQLFTQELWTDAKERLVTSSNVNTQPKNDSHIKNLLSVHNNVTVKQLGCNDTQRISSSESRQKKIKIKKDNKLKKDPYNFPHLHIDH